MAEVHLKSQIVTDLDTVPVVKTNQIESGGVSRQKVAVITTNADDSADSTYRMVRIPSRARVSSVLVRTDAASTNGTADVGLYLADGGAVVDADFFSAAFAIKTASGEAAFGNTARMGDPTKVGKRLWEVLGLSEDPRVDYDIALTIVEAITGAADKLGVIVTYVLDE